MSEGHGSRAWARGHASRTWATRIMGQGHGHWSGPMVKGMGQSLDMVADIGHVGLQPWYVYVLPTHR